MKTIQIKIVRHFKKSSRSKMKWTSQDRTLNYSMIDKNHFLRIIIKWFKNLLKKKSIVLLKRLSLLKKLILNLFVQTRECMPQLKKLWNTPWLMELLVNMLIVTPFNNLLIREVKWKKFLYSDPMTWSMVNNILDYGILSVMLFTQVFQY